MEELLSIGEVAAEAGVPTSTLRYYDRINLVPSTSRVRSQRRFAPSVLGRLRAVALCQRAGFTLEEIACLLDGGGGWPELAADKAGEITARISDLQDALEVLNAAVACGCERLETCDRTTHLIAMTRPAGRRGLANST